VRRPARTTSGAPPVERLERLTGWLGTFAAWAAARCTGPLFESTATATTPPTTGTSTGGLGRTKPFAASSPRPTPPGCVWFSMASSTTWVATSGLPRRPGRRRRVAPIRDWFAGLRFDRRSPFGDPFAYAAGTALRLVKLDLGNPAVREHLFGAVESWIRDFDIDGLRLDAADVVDLGSSSARWPGCAAASSPTSGSSARSFTATTAAGSNPQTLDSGHQLRGLQGSLREPGRPQLLRDRLHPQPAVSGPGGMYAGLPLYNFVDNHDQDRVASRLGQSASSTAQRAAVHDAGRAVDLLRLRMGAKREAQARDDSRSVRRSTWPRARVWESSRPWPTRSGGWRK